jgi:histone H3/H4
MSELPIASVTRIIRNAGAERVSEDASQELIRLLEEEAEKIAGTTTLPLFFLFYVEKKNERNEWKK